MQRIKEYQKVNGLTQQDLARTFKISVSMMSMLATSQRLPSLPLAVLIEEETMGFVAPRDWIREASE